MVTEITLIYEHQMGIFPFIRTNISVHSYFSLHSGVLGHFFRPNTTN